MSLASTDDPMSDVDQQEEGPVVPGNRRSISGILDSSVLYSLALVISGHWNNQLSASQEMLRACSADNTQRDELNPWIRTFQWPHIAYAEEKLKADLVSFHSRITQRTQTEDENDPRNRHEPNSPKIINWEAALDTDTFELTWSLQYRDITQQGRQAKEDTWRQEGEREGQDPQAGSTHQGSGQVVVHLPTRRSARIAELYHKVVVMEEEE